MNRTLFTLVSALFVLAHCSADDGQSGVQVVGASGTAGQSGGAGSGGENTAGGGQSGESGSAGEAGVSGQSTGGSGQGAGGQSSGGSSGNAGQSGQAGQAGQGASAGLGGQAGISGQSGNGGQAGNAGVGASAAQGGTGGQSLPTCDCYYGNGAYCASGVLQEAQSRGCSVGVAESNSDDILNCSDGNWTISQDCSNGCYVAPPGQPDGCNSLVTENQYYLPWACSGTFSCTQGNFGDTCGGGTGSHTGQQQYAFDFGLPRHTPVYAARGGEVIHSDNLVGPGDSCYDGCSDSNCCNTCINTVNRVVIRHSDGTTALYLHFDQATAQQGSVVQTGDLLGYSGISGCSFGAHLHFQLQEDCGIWFCNSLPVQFVEYPSMACGVTETSQNCP